MTLAFRTVFYDAQSVHDRHGPTDWNYQDVLRAGSCFEPGTSTRYRSEREKMMIDPSPNERSALEAASDAGGAHLETVGQTDLAELTTSQWMTFLEVVVSAYQDTLAERAASIQADEVPF